MRSAHPGVRAEMPDDDMRGRAPDGRVLPYLRECSSDGRLIGVYLIERKRRKRGSARAP
jgi:hypothetical protein